MGLNMKRLPQYCLITMVLLTFIFTSCDEDNIINPLPSELFYPLSIGNTWHYNYQRYDSLGVLTYEAPIKESIVTLRTRNDGTNAFQLNSPINPRSPACCDYRYYLQNKIDGVHWVTASDSTGYFVYDNLQYKFPCDKDDIFVMNSSNQDTIFVVSTNDTVICNAGKFNCIVYKYILKMYNDSNVPEILGYSLAYISYGIGKVKFELYLTTSKNEFYKLYEYSLTNYTIN
jgi:hypothetical protein